MDDKSERLSEKRVNESATYCGECMNEKSDLRKKIERETMDFLKFGGTIDCLQHESRTMKDYTGISREHLRRKVFSGQKGLEISPEKSSVV